MGQLDMFSLQGRVALIPGGGGGIGAPMAEAMAAAGARVVVAGRTQDALQAAVDRVTAAGSEGLAITGDATMASAPRTMTAPASSVFILVIWQSLPPRPCVAFFLV